MPSSNHDQAQRLAQFPDAMLAWYDNEKRSLPWRENPTPYRVWISEIMLQQTRVEAVIGYYERFLSALPDIHALAQAPQEQLMKLWEGLGYYTRARNLQKAAQVMDQQYAGQFPGTYDEIRALPGIGDYTAGAIASIAFSLKHPAVDGNVLRVMTRLTADGGDISKPATKQRISSLLTGLLPDRVGDFNQSLMELGATVCIPNGTPACLICPVREYCLGFSQGSPEDYPVKPKKKARTVEEYTVFLLDAGGRLALSKRPERGLLAGLWELPNVPGCLSQEAAEQWVLTQGFSHTQVCRLRSCRHIFTHVEWHMSVYAAQVSQEAGSFFWAGRQALHDSVSLPSAFRPALAQWEPRNQS